jgi:hypothetical protein
MKNITIILNSRKYIPILVLFSFTLFSCKPVSPTINIQSPSETHTITPTNTLFSTPSQTSTKSYPEWPVLYSETFDDNNRGWQIDEEDNTYYQGLFSILDGKYIANIKAKKGVHLSIASNYRTPLDDVDLSVDIDKSYGSKYSNCGLVFRQQEKSLYYFAIYEETQQYTLSKLIDNQWITIIKPSFTPYIVPQLINHIRVMVKGSLFTFFINGKIVNQVIDKSIYSGRVTIGIELNQPNDIILVSFDNFEVRTPK